MNGSVVVLFLGAAGTPGVQADPKPTPQQFDSLNRLICTQTDESKRGEVSWLTDLDEARKRAAEEDKPLLLWRSGEGDVLGRT